MTSEQDQVFGANPKIGLRKKECFCRALTLHIRSQDFKRVSLRLAIDHTLVSKKGVMNDNSNKNFATTKKKNTYYKTAHINLRAPK